MSQTNETTLDDVAESINTLGTLIGERINEVEASLEAKITGIKTTLEAKIDGVNTSLGGRIDGVNWRLDKLDSRMFNQEKAQRETNKRLTSVEGKLVAVENDIKELYGYNPTLYNEGSE
jgi:hypothetical protein